MADNDTEQDTPSWHEYYARQAEACRDPALRHFYTTGLPAPETRLGDLSLMAVDFETTGMDAQRHAIVSIGMVPFTLHVIRPAAGRYWVVKPPGGLRPESIAFHRITHSEVAHAPDLDAILDEVLDALAGHVVVVHYRNIERPFLDAAVMAARGEHCLFPVIDTMTLEARRERLGAMAALKRVFGLPLTSIRLADTRARYGLPAYTSHHAKLDALATAELFQAQVARHYSPDIPVAELWV